MAEGIARALVSAGDRYLVRRIESDERAARSGRRAPRDRHRHLGLSLEGRFGDSTPAEIDTVITLCAEEVCPVFFGSAERLHWPLPDPAAVKGSEEARLAAFRETRDELRRRIEALIERKQGGEVE